MSTNPGPSVSPRAALACCSPGEAGSCVQCLINQQTVVAGWVLVRNASDVH